MVFMLRLSSATALPVTPAAAPTASTAGTTQLDKETVNPMLRPMNSIVGIRRAGVNMWFAPRVGVWGIRRYQLNRKCNARPAYAFLGYGRFGWPALGFLHRVLVKEVPLCHRLALSVKSHGLRAHVLHESLLQ